MGPRGTSHLSLEAAAGASFPPRAPLTVPSPAPPRGPAPPACSGRKRWILSVPVKGDVWLDHGAVHAVRDRKKSLFSAVGGAPAAGGGQARRLGQRRCTRKSFPKPNPKP